MPKTRNARSVSRRSLPPLDETDPQLATLVDRPPTDGQWVYEIKYDGYRLLAGLQRDAVTLRSRNNLDWTGAFPFVRNALQELNASAIIDGEICYVEADGRTSFQQLQQALPRGGGSVPKDAQKRLVFYMFDLLFIDGDDITDSPLLKRKQKLQTLLGKKPPWPLAYSNHLETDGRTALAQACQAD